jgi:anaerobic ribonucleoside-triphosphate reductase activating protein
MKIASTQYSLDTQSFEIYLSGCNGCCEGCYNPELKDFNIGKDYLTQINKIKNKIKKFDKLIKNIWLLGGDPIDQDLQMLEDLMIQLKTLDIPIWIWTRHNLMDIPINILRLCSCIKTGAYIPALKTDDNIQYGVKLATSNQNIIKMEVLT